MRYKINDKSPKNIKSFVLERLKEFSFTEIDSSSLSEKTSGWVSSENMASTFFDDLYFAKDPYLVFSLRIDQKKIPPLSMKAALLKQEIKYKKDTGLEKLRKQDRDMLKDEVWQSLLKKTLPSPSVYDVCWNSSSQIVLFLSNSMKSNDEFVSLFYRCFGMKLLPLTPEVLAGDDQGQKKENVVLINRGGQSA